MASLYGLYWYTTKFPTLVDLNDRTSSSDGNDKFCVYCAHITNTSLSCHVQEGDAEAFQSFDFEKHI